MKQNRFFSWLMASPALLTLFLLSVFPLGYTLWYSFSDYYYLSLSPAGFIGLENYQRLAVDAYFLQAVWNTLKFMMLAVFFEIVLGLLYALFVNSLRRFRRLLRTLALLPMLLPPVTVALVWQIMLSNNYGLLNTLLERLGLIPHNWLMDPHTAFYAILLIDIWQYTPLAFLLIYAALQLVPAEQYEAAALDGASPLRQFLHVTWPNIYKSVMVVVLLRAIDTFRLFDKVNILTNGGPANTTSTITQYIYHYGVQMLKVGYASAAAVIMTGIVLVLLLPYLKRILLLNRNQA